MILWITPQKLHITIRKTLDHQTINSKTGFEFLVAAPETLKTCGPNGQVNTEARREMSLCLLRERGTDGSKTVRIKICQNQILGDV